MSGLILICMKTENNELIVDYAVSTATDTNVVVPQVHPVILEGEFNKEIGEWVINV